MAFLLFALLNPLNDVSTSTVDPPQFADGALVYTEESLNTQKKLYPDLAGLELKSPDSRTVFNQVLSLARGQDGWSVTAVDNEKMHLEAVATTKLLHFKDDIAIDVRPSSDGSVVHMRSRSRVGKSDLGANERRIKNFFDNLSTSILAK